MSFLLGRKEHDKMLSINPKLLQLLFRCNKFSWCLSGVTFKDISPTTANVLENWIKEHCPESVKNYIVES